MLTEITTVLGSLGTGAVVGSFVTHRLSIRRDSVIDSREQLRPAAVALREALAEVRRMVATSPPAGLVEPRAVSERMASWGRTFERWQAWLPSHAHHLDRSVSDAVSTHLGILGRSHRLPEYVSEDLSDNTDVEWQEKAVDYLGYLCWWLDESCRRGRWSRRLYNYDEWLAFREARQAAIGRGEFTRFDRLINRFLRAY